ncbi:hypothetical protein PAHAL_9G136500 [Panicum hallii]|uniref:VQ domain-containing protein n=1 Tax=Panicum hallii TaxID=206008 RepID=A0A2T8I177_9POAL|nr:uncharacterized protein LOC112876916 [Panicum hallii]PVH31402.1 hypothetical protein PAHAL_9G136500 [Panicum hallii]
MRSRAPPAARRTSTARARAALVSRGTSSRFAPGIRRSFGMDHGGERRSSAHGAAARPWRAGAPAGGAQPPPKVYRVEPRDFRELVQRLTGAGSTAAAPGPAAQQSVVTPAMVAESRRLEAAAAAAAAPEQQFDCRGTRRRCSALRTARPASADTSCRL